jgi:drug/metabolite transporter (DMT)-like permease
VAVVATLEPVLATLIAWAVHDEALAAVQLLGVAVVVAAVAWVQTHPPSDEVEAVPAWGVERASRRAKEEATANR